MPYHRACLICSRCRASLSNNIREHKSRPVCLDCFAFFEGKRCARCGEGAASGINALGARFHADCWTCSECNQKLGNAFVEDNGRPLHEECLRRREEKPGASDKAPGSAWSLMEGSNKCETCRKTIEVGEGLSVKAPKTDGARLYFHEQCFQCASCKTVLRGQYVAAENGFFCARCGNAKETTRIDADPCPKCRQPLVGNLVKALGSTYHRDCFGCAKCGKGLAGKGFVDVGGKAHCEDCA